MMVVAAPAAGLAQEPDSRAAEIAQEQAEKARDLKPYTRNVFERKLLEIEQGGGFAVQRGFFIALGDIKQGSSVAIGPAYGKQFANGGAVIAKAAYSIRDFKLLQLYAAAPAMARGRLQVNGRVRWQDAPELAVYALGPDSPKTRADFSETRTEVSGQAEFRPVRFIRLGGGAAFERYETGGADTTRPSVENFFSPLEMPGIGADPTYVHSFVSGGLDSRTGPGYSRSGTLLHGALHAYSQQNGGPFSFRRVDAIARQLIPILHGNWVLDLSVRTSTTSTDDGNTVPFFLLPDLGGSGELRGYSAYRFRDRNSIIFTGEYRWYVQEFVDMALFYDAGKVTPRRGDLDFENLKSNVGMGIRFHGPQTTVLRIELAKGNEGLRFIFAFSAPVR
jgi:Omp85 superfamily domain